MSLQCFGMAECFQISSIIDIKLVPCMRTRKKMNTQVRRKKTKEITVSRRRPYPVMWVGKTHTLDEVSD